MRNCIKRAVLIPIIFIAFISVAYSQESDSSNLTANNDFIPYTVKEGDTLFSLAAKYRIPIKHIRVINNINGNNLYAGKTIYIPKDPDIELASFTKESVAQQLPEEELVIEEDIPQNGEFIEEGVNGADQVDNVDPQEQIEEEDIVEEVPEEQVEAEDTKADSQQQEEKKEKEAAKPEPPVTTNPSLEIVVPEQDSPSQKILENDIVNLQSEMELRILFRR